jgi:hypothetical protein
MQVQSGCSSGLGSLVFPVVFVTVVVLIARRAQQARIAKLTALARRHGLRFSEALPRPPAPPSLLESEERAGSFALEGRLEGMEATVFDYTTGSGKAAVTQTVVTFRAEGRVLPPFLLNPEGLTDKIAARFGGQDLDFDDDPAFSAAYRLQSRGDEAGVRALFGPPVRARLAAALPKKGHVEAWGDRLAVWAPGGRLAPERFEERLRAAAEVARAFGR